MSSPGAVCSGGSTEEGHSGEEAVRLLASPAPAVDVLGGNPQAAQNVAGESPRHAPQPVAAAPRPVPPFTSPSTVPLPESNTLSFLSMEGTSEALPVISIFKDIVSEEERSTAEVVSVPTLLTEDCGSSAEMQQLPAPFCPPVASDTQIDNTVQEMQYESQTDEEKKHSHSQTNQIQTPEEGAGRVLITGTKEKQFITLQYKPEIKTNLELVGNEHTGGTTLPHPQSQSLSHSVPQPNVGFKVSTKHEAMEKSDWNSHADTNEGSHIPLSALVEKPSKSQDSKASPLHVLSSGCSEVKQTDLSKTQPKQRLVNETSADANEMQKTNSLLSVQTFEQVKTLVETQPYPAETVETPKASPHSVSSNTAGSAAGNTQGSCNILDGKLVECSSREDQTDTATSSDSVLPECSTHETPSTPSLFGTGLVVSLAETSQPSGHIPATEMPLIAELVHSTDAKEIVVVREEAHISRDWSNMHLNQSYLLQRDDGTVCEAAIVNELSSESSTGEQKLYAENVDAAIALHSQPVEVYEFCGLVEEVAEETVCAGSTAQMPHSPGYEVNLFNALLEHPDEYTVKEDLESHPEPSSQTINETDTVIISQQPLPSLHNAGPMQACSNSSHNLSKQNTRVAAVGQHLVLDANQVIEVANSSKVCLVEVAAVTSDSFTFEQTDTMAQNTASSSQLSASHSEKIDSHVVSHKKEAEAATGSLSLVSPVGPVTIHVSHVENQTPAVELTVVSAAKPDACVSLQEGTKETPPLKETQPQSIHNVAVPKQINLEAFCTTLSSGTLNPKLLLFQPGATPVLKHPPSFLAKVSKQQNAAEKLASANSSWSGTKSEECISQTVSATDSLCTSSSQKNQTQCPVNDILATAASPIRALKSTVTNDFTIQLAHNESVIPTSNTDKEALTETSADVEPASQVRTPPALSLNPDMLTSLMEGEGSSPTEPQLGTFSAEEESEDMEPDEPMGETETQEATSGQVSSPEEGSDEENDDDKIENKMTTPSSAHKVFL